MRSITTDQETVLGWFAADLPQEYMPRHVGLTAWTWKNAGYEVSGIRGWDTPDGTILFILAYRDNGPTLLLGAWRRMGEENETLFEGQWNEAFAALAQTAHQQHWTLLWRRFLRTAEIQMTLAILLLYAASVWLFMDSPLGSEENILPLCLAGIVCAVLGPALCASRLRASLARRQLVRFWKDDPLANTIQRVVWVSEDPVLEVA